MYLHYLERVKIFENNYPHKLISNEFKVKFELGLKTKTGRNMTYNPDFYCPETDEYIEVTTSRNNRSLQGWKWRKTLELGHKLRIFEWDGKEITKNYE